MTTVEKKRRTTKKKVEEKQPTTPLVIPNNATPVSELYSRNKNMPFIPKNSMLVSHKLPIVKSNCFWDRHEFDYEPIGCPIDYIDGKYVSDGCFCSFNCCMAYIEDNSHNYTYAKSKYLLSRIHFEIFNDPKFEITPAPSWRLLQAYGGSWSIEKFRESLTHVVVTHRMGVSKVLEYRPVGHIYEEHIVI